MDSKRLDARPLGSVEEILRRVDEVPELTGFPPVDELLERFDALAERHPDLVRTQRIGTSRLGEHIPMYTIGDGALTHLIVGGVHPNEPIGFWTALHLATTLLEDDGFRDELDATWHIIPCIDPDGTRLNEDWFSDHADRDFYLRRFYRPGSAEQVEWSFPANYKKLYFDEVMPETQALMRVIDTTRPDMLMSLHNSEMGGVYYYLSRPIPQVIDVLERVPAHVGLPLNTGEPEAPHAPVYGSAIYGMVPISETYDYIERLGLDPERHLSGGSGSAEYAGRHGTLSVVAELPFWSHPDADDETPISATYSDVLESMAAAVRDMHARLNGILQRAEPHLTLDTPFRRAAHAFIPGAGDAADSTAARAAAPESNRPATVAERFGCEEYARSFKLRFGAILVRALEGEVESGIAPPEVRRLAREAAALVAEWQAEPSRGASATTIPVRSLVGVQYGAILAAATALEPRAT